MVLFRDIYKKTFSQKSNFFFPGRERVYAAEKTLRPFPSLPDVSTTVYYIICETAAVLKID